MTDHSEEPVGSLAEELAKLMGVVSGLADQTADDGVAGEGDGDHETEPASDGPDHAAHIANGSAACQVCPVCQAIAFVRSTSPEVRDHLASSAASLAAAARGLLDGMTTPQPEPDRRDSPVENINLSEDEKWD